MVAQGYCFSTTHCFCFVCITLNQVKLHEFARKVYRTCLHDTVNWRVLFQYDAHCITRQKLLSCDRRVSGVIVSTKDGTIFSTGNDLGCRWGRLQSHINNPMSFLINRRKSHVNLIWLINFCLTRLNLIKFIIINQGLRQIG